MFEKLTEKYLDNLLELEQELFSLPWTKEMFEFELNQNPFSNIIGYFDNSQLIGYIGYWITDDNAQITTLGVRKDYQKQGIGQRLIKYVTQKAKNAKCILITLEVRVSNQSAINLYLKEGYKINHIKEKYYYDNGEDAYYMIKDLRGDL